MYRWPEVMENWDVVIKLNKFQGNKGYAPCSNCARSTRQEILVSVDREASCDPDSGFIETDFFSSNLWMIDSFQIIKCGGCEHISFRHKYTFSEDTEVTEVADEHGFLVLADVPIERVDIYPKGILRQKIRQVDRLPRIVRLIYEETRSALGNNELVLAGMGIRALVESVAKNKETAGKKLAESIASLVKVGLLTEEKGNFLHILRHMGNESAHEGKAHSYDDLMTALDIVEHLLDEVYILPLIVGRLPKKPLSEIES